MNQNKTPAPKNRPKNRSRRGRYKDSPHYKEEIRLRWTFERLTGPKRGSNVYKWMENWDRLRMEAVRLGLEIDGSRDSCLNFIYCVRDVIPLWWKIEYYYVVLHEQPVELRLLMDDFRASCKRWKPWETPLP